jgi:adenosine deaminase
MGMALLTGVLGWAIAAPLLLGAVYVSALPLTRRMIAAKPATSFDDALRIAKRLPKTELHLHLDGSLPAEFIRARAAARGVSAPPTNGELRTMIDDMKANRAKTAASTDARDITAVASGKNWAIFDWMNQFLQTAAELEEATCALASALRTEHEVWYAEVRFCPTLHVLEGLSEEAALAAVVAGFARAKAATGLRGGILVCALRSHPAPHPLAMATLAAQYLHRGVVGFDVAGSETYPLSLPAISDALHAAKVAQVPITLQSPRGGSNAGAAVSTLGLASRC